MNTQNPAMSMESLLNLDTLTEEERKIILSVLKKDDELKKTQDKKIGQLKLEIQGIRMKSVLRNGDDLSKICARCHSELGFLFNRGDLCPKCHFRVCQACQDQVLGGTWLCILCHKQRQLRFLTEEWNNKGKKTKKTGTELVKASMMKKRRPGRVENETSDKSRRVQNGNPIQNGSAYRNKKEAENERIEYPNDSDRRKLSQLFDSFKLSKSSDKSDDSDTKQQISVRKLSTKRYEDSESSSSDSEGSVEAVQNSLTSVSDTHSSENVSRLKNTARGVLQRNYSDDSDQTAMSDETPFLKNAGSTETQIRVDIHSDSSGTPQQIKRVVNHQTSKSNHIHDQVIRTDSISSYRSTSPEIIGTPGVQKHQGYWQNRSPSPYSFDSIPSSHADSPLPKKRFSSEIHQRDSDSDSRISGVSGVSGSGEHSGTESAVKDSGEEEYAVEELTKIRFRRVSRKHTRSDDATDSSHSTVSEVHQRGLTGKGRVLTVDLPEEKGRVQVSQISLTDLEQDIDLDDEYVNLDFVPNLSKKYGDGFDKLEFSADNLRVQSSQKLLDEHGSDGQERVSKEQQKLRSHLTKKTSPWELIDAKRNAKVDSVDIKSVDDTPIGSISERRKKLEQAMKQEWHGKDFKHELESRSDQRTHEDWHESSNKPSPKSENTDSFKSKDPSASITKQNTSKEQCKEPVSSAILNTGNKGTSSLDSEFNEIFNLAVADLSVDESTTDMSDTGSLSRAKGKKIKKLMKRRKIEKKERKLSENDDVDDNGDMKREDKVMILTHGADVIQKDINQELLKSEQNLRQKTEVVTSDHASSGQRKKIDEKKASTPAKEEYILEEALEETISPVCIIREESSGLSIDRLDRIEKDDRMPETSVNKERASTNYVVSDNEREVKEVAGEKGDDLLSITQEMIESGEIDLDKLSLGEIRVLMKHNILPMDEELMQLIDEEFRQNRHEPAASFDSDELSIIHEESEPSDSDNSNGEIQSRGADISKSTDFKFCIPEVIIEEYVDEEEGDIVVKIGESFDENLETCNVSVEKIEEHQGMASCDQEVVHEHDECSSILHKGNPVSNDTKSSPVVGIKDLQKIYQDVKEQVALETYMETKKTKIVDPSYDSDQEEDNDKSSSLTKKEMASKSIGTSGNQIGSIQVSLFGAKSYDVNKMSEVILQGENNEDLQTDILHHGIATETHLKPDMNKFADEEETDRQDKDIPSITDQTGKKDFRSISQNEITSETNLENKLEIQSPSMLKDEKCRSPVLESSPCLPKTSISEGKNKTPDSSSSYQHVDTPYIYCHGDSYLIGRSDVSADVTLTPTEQSMDSENTFCSTLEGNIPEKEQRLMSTKKSDLVGQSLSREVLVKQWLSSKTEMRDDICNSQTNNAEINTENPALHSVNPACDLNLSGRQTGALPKLNMQEWKETETDSVTKLSPRASSEGSASLEDSGHVSGASTQENTPEHRRTDSLQSQTSMGSSRLSTLTDKESEEDADIDELVRSHKSQHSSLGGSRGNLLSAFTESRESIVSFYSNAGDVDYGKIPISGDIEFGLDYNYRTGTLEINIVRCKGLAPADTKRNRSDPYVKTYLLPDKTRGGKRKTKIKKHTLNPVFNETLRYLISKSELENRTVWITVWHNDRFGRNDFLGEVTVNFDYYRFGDSAPKWYKLQERFEQPMSLLAYKGDIILCLKYVPPEKVKRDVNSPPSPTRKRLRKPVSSDKGQLHVMIKEARNLTAVRSNGHSDPFCKGQLQPDKEKQKTHVIKKECNPVWNCTMVFDDVNVASLREKSLELTIWDYDKITSNDFLGGVRLNLGTGRSYGKNVDWMDARGEEISLWQAMLDRPNFWIDGALVLRPSMSKRK